MALNPTGKERRKHTRVTPRNIRVWCTSGEMEEVRTAVNFARELVNVSLGGLCIVTAGRLRPGVKMCVEMRFDAIGGTLRSDARVSWALDKKGRGQEGNLTGLEFVGEQEMTESVREFLTGGRMTLIESERGRDFRDLTKRKEKETARAKARTEAMLKEYERVEASEEPPKRSRFRKRVVMLLVFAVFYVGSFWGLVFTGKLESKDSSIHFRYLGSSSKGGAAESILSIVFTPAYGLFKLIGIDLRYDPP